MLRMLPLHIQEDINYYVIADAFQRKYKLGVQRLHELDKAGFPLRYPMQDIIDGTDRMLQLAMEHELNLSNLKNLCNTKGVILHTSRFAILRLSCQSTKHRTEETSQLVHYLLWQTKNSVHSKVTDNVVRMLHEYDDPSLIVSMLPYRRSIRDLAISNLADSISMHDMDISHITQSLQILCVGNLDAFMSMLLNGKQTQSKINSAVLFLIQQGFVNVRWNNDFLIRHYIFVEDDDRMARTLIHHGSSLHLHPPILLSDYILKNNDLNASFKCLPLLLENGIECDLLTMRHLMNHLISHKPHLSVFIFLLDRGHITLQPSDFKEIMNTAIFYNHTKLMEALLRRQPILSDEEYIHSAHLNANYTFFLQVVSHTDPSMFHPDFCNEYVLKCCSAYRVDNFQKLKFWLARGGDIHFNGEAPFLAFMTRIRHLFSYHHFNSYLDLMVELCVDFAAQDSEAMFILLKQMTNYYRKLDAFLMNFLLKHGCDVHARSELALSLAVKANNIGMCTMLLENGADRSAALVQNELRQKPKHKLLRKLLGAPTQI